MEQQNQVAGWGIERDPYDNYQEVRAEMGQSRRQAMPAYYQQNQILTNTYTEPNEVETVIEDIYEEEDLALESAGAIAEAVARIEQAKLYETLLSHTLLAQGSARPEILDKVQGEIKAFVLERLETLLGMRSEKSKIVHTKDTIVSPFDTDEVSALKALAAKVLKREPQVSVGQPQIRPLEAPKPIPVPEVKPLVVAAPQPMASKEQLKSKIVAKPKKKVQAKSNEPKLELKEGEDITPEMAAQILASRKPRKTAAASVSKAIPMPSADQMNKHTEMQAQTTLPNLGGGNSVLLKAIQASLK